METSYVWQHQNNTKLLAPELNFDCKGVGYKGYIVGCPGNMDGGWIT